METKYFTVNTSNTNNEHVGTIVSNNKTDEEFTEAVKRALETHFDAVVEVCSLKVEDYIYGRSGTAEIRVGSTDEFIDEIFIQETWLYE
jgi:hypothetical protein